jgi:sugar/nucleoside kinase (ribokinase family)
MLQRILNTHYAKVNKRYYGVGMKRIFIMGNPLMDRIHHGTRAKLEELGFTPGSMNLVSADQQSLIMDSFTISKIAAGGSAANTARGMAWLSESHHFESEIYYLGSLGQDQSGDDFHDLLNQANIISNCPRSSKPTGSSSIVVSEDVERTMFTYLGACQELTPKDLDIPYLESSDWFYSTGYMFDTDNQEATIRKAVETMKTKGKKIAFDIADPFVAQRFGITLVDWIPESVDLLFANQEEISMLLEMYGQKQNLQKNYRAMDVNELANEAKIFAPMVMIKLGKQGCIIADRNKDNNPIIPVEPAKAVDTTGAGDSFAAGFLTEYMHTQDSVQSAKVANNLARQVVCHEGCQYKPIDRSTV